MSKKKTKHHYLGKGFKLFLAFLLAFGIGFIWGHSQAIDVCYKVGSKYVEVVVKPEILEAIRVRYGI